MRTTTGTMQPDYSRQISLKEVGPDGQATLARSRVLVVGAGGLGSPVLQYLAGAGVGHLGIVEPDTLDASNLHRQPLYTLADTGKSKVALARAALLAINPSITVETHARPFCRGQRARPGARTRPRDRLQRQFPHQVPHQ